MIESPYALWWNITALPSALAAAQNTNSVLLQPGLCAAREPFSPSGDYQWKHFPTQPLLVNIRFQTPVA